MKRNGAVIRNSPKKFLACMSARRRRPGSPDVHLYELLSVIHSMQRDAPDAVTSYSWNIQHRKRDQPQIRIIMLVDNMASVAAVAASLANAFEDIDNVAFVLTVDEDAFFEMVTVDCVQHE